MTTIWKFAIPNSGEFTLEMPMDAVPLHVNTQQAGSGPDKLFMWAWLNTLAPARPYTFFLAATGQEVVGNWNYLGTVKILDGAVMYHLFQAKD